MEKVWGITSGSYSDYRVQALFATKAQAEEAVRLAQATSEDDGIWSRAEDIAEFAFYPEGSGPPVIHTVFFRSVVVLDSGEVTEERTMETREWEYGLFMPVGSPERPEVRFVRAPIYKGSAGRLEVRGINRRAVDQAYSDNLARVVVAAEQTGKATL